MKSSHKYLGFVKKKAPNEEEDLRTYWNGEELGTLARVHSLVPSPETNKFSLELQGVSRVQILNCKRTIYGYFEGFLS